MAIVTGPKNGTSAAEYGRLQRASDGPDQVTSGLQVTFFAGRTVRLAAGSGRVGGFGFVNTASVDFTSDAETTGNPRIDRLVARLPAPGADVVFAILKGGAASPPSLPPLTQIEGGVWEFGLAYWIVPAGSGGNITNGKVWGHYADDGAQFKGDADVSIATGTNALLLNVFQSDPHNPLQFAVPGSATVAMDVVLSCLAIAPCAGVVTLQMAGLARTATYKAMAAGPFTLTIPRFEARIDKNGGHVPAVIQMSVEGVFGAATPLRVGRIDPHMFQVMS